MSRVQRTLISPKKGEPLEGTITKLTSSEILVDIGAKTEAQVLEKDKNNLRTLLSLLKVGDKVTVSVLNPESDFGNPVVSLRRFLDRKLWDKVEALSKSKKPQDIIVNEETRGGYVVATTDGVKGFLPNSHVMGKLSLGQKATATLLEFDREQHKIIFSQKKTVDANVFAKAVRDIKIGQKINSVISSIAPFGIFISVPVGDDNFIEGFIHISEISWEKLENIPQEFAVGNKVDGVVLGFDRKSSRVNLSIKRLTVNPYIEKLKEYTGDKKVKGKVSRISSSGVEVELEEGVVGFIKKEKIPVDSKFEEGAEIQATVVSVDEKNHRVMLVPYLTRKAIGYR